MVIVKIRNALITNIKPVGSIVNNEIIAIILSMNLWLQVIYFLLVCGVWGGVAPVVPDPLHNVLRLLL